MENIFDNYRILPNYSERFLSEFRLLSIFRLLSFLGIPTRSYHIDVAYLPFSSLFSTKISVQEKSIYSQDNSRTIVLASKEKKAFKK